VSEDKPPYGTAVAKPDAKSGVEVGGGDKAAAAVNPKAREEATSGGSKPKMDEPNPEDPQEAKSPT
jgi:hypothetical protein